MKTHSAAKPSSYPWLFEGLLLLSAVLFLCDAARAAARPVPYVVTREVDSTTTPSVMSGEKPAAIHFCRAQVVLLKKRAGKRALVATSDDFTKAWIPQSALAGPDEFTPVITWNGPFKLDLYQGDGDTTYQFRRDGTFTSVSSGSDDGPVKSKGQLYTNGDLIWARYNHDRTGFDDWSVFRRDAKGELHAVDLEGC